MPICNVGFHFAVKYRSVILQLPFATLIPQVEGRQYAYKGTRWRLHPQLLRFVVLDLGRQ